MALRSLKDSDGEPRVLSAGGTFPEHFFLKTFHIYHIPNAIAIFSYLFMGPFGCGRFLFTVNFCLPLLNRYTLAFSVVGGILVSSCEHQ